MRTRLVVIVTAALLLMVALAAPAVAQTDKPLNCVVKMATGVEGAPDWYGTIRGDINGMIGFSELQGGALNTVNGTTEHFIESWTIWVGGDTISGVNEGVWSFVNFKFRANGVVTNATGDWAYLVGYRFHELGVTSPFDPATGEGWPITADGLQLRLVAP